MFNRSHWKWLSLLFVVCLLLVGLGSMPLRVQAERPAATAPQAPDAINFAKVAAGAEFNCALTASGGAKCWGKNASGQLGDGTTITRNTPVDVTGLTSGVTAVAASGSHACALTVGGGVKCWGSSIGSYGGLIPEDVTGLTSNVIAIAVGGSHACALMSTNGVKCWGSNSSGQVGDGTTSYRSNPVDVSGLSSGVVDIAAGGNHSCAILSSGALRCWGENTYGQLGDASNTNRLSPVDVMGLSNASTVAVGTEHTCALTAGGGVKCWGRGDGMRLGTGGATTNTPQDVFGLTSGVTAISAGAEHTCVIVTGGGAKCWGSNMFGQLGIVSSSGTPYHNAVDVTGLTSGVGAIAAGGYHSCAALAGGGAKCWGQNTYGQLGNGTFSWRSIPTVVSNLSNDVAAVSPGARHTCALTTLGGVKCWGYNDNNGYLGNGSTTSSNTPVDVTGLTTGVAAVSVGSEHTCALLNTGEAKCWGKDYLGNGSPFGSSTPVTVTGLTNATRLDAGRFHTCVRTATGAALCWGANSSGQLGDGTTTTQDVPVAVSGLGNGVVTVGGGDNFTCALTDTGGVKCWGNNAYGQVGDGTFTQHTTPVDVIGLSSGVTLIAVGGSHACAVMANSGVKCWGSNSSKQVGITTTDSIAIPVTVPGLTGVTALTAGKLHTCALLTNGSVKCWGRNEEGQLGNGALTMPTHSPVEVTGLAGGVAAIAAGEFHTCAVTTSQRLKCWGSDGESQIGLGFNTSGGIPGDVLESAVSLAPNYAVGKRGSIIEITVANFPPNSPAMLSVNNTSRLNALTTNATGGSVFFLDTTDASNGVYTVTLSVNPSASTVFTVTESAPLRSPEGSGTTFVLDGLGLMPLKLVYLPLILR